VFAHSLRSAQFRLLGLAAGLASLVLTVGSAAPAQAALISTGACDSSSLTKPFAAWGDSNPYKLLPGGDFEGSLAGWTLRGGAQRVSGGEPQGISGTAGGAAALSLPPGASVQSPLTCVNSSYPLFRLFARNQGLASTVVAQVLYRNPILGLVPLPLGLVALNGRWQPTLPMLTGSVVGGLLSGGTVQVALRFTALTGTTEIDDVFVDPRMN
jgi:hypothetical protein